MITVVDRFLKSEVYKDCIRAEMSAAAGSERNINNNCVRWVSVILVMMIWETCLLQRWRCSQTEKHWFIENQEKKINEFLGALAQDSWHWHWWHQSWDWSWRQVSSWSTVYTDQGHLPRPGHQCGELQHRGKHQSHDQQTPGQEEHEADQFWCVQQQEWLQATGSVRRLRHPPLYRGESGGQDTLQTGTSISQVYWSQGELSYLFPSGQNICI